MLWKYSTTEDTTIERQARTLFEKYSNDLYEDIVDEIKDLKKIHFANISSSTLGPFDLFIKLHQLHFETIFSNVCLMFRIFFAPFQCPWHPLNNLSVLLQK